MSQDMATEMQQASQTSGRTGARVLVDQLVIQGVDTIFCVPGESFLSVLDALYDTPQIRLVTCRHEGGAAMMAEAYGKLTGRPGIVFCSRGPGATNASAGLHVAHQDSTPFIMFIGQIARDDMTREAFQEVEYRRVFSSMAKGVFQIENAGRVSETVTRAFALALNGRPGPVVIPIPEDMQRDVVGVQDGARCEPVRTAPGAADMARVRDAMVAAERPLILVGGSDWDAEAVRALEGFAEANNLPVCATFRRQDRFNNDHPNYIGEVGLGANPKLLKRIAEADLILALGARLGDIGTNAYATMTIPRPAQKLIHVYPDPDEFGHVFQPAMQVLSAPGTFARALARLEPVRGGWPGWTEAARADFEGWTAPRRIIGDMQMCEIVKWLDDTVPDDTIYTNGAGNFSVWLHRFHRYRSFGTQVAPVSGSMGYGIPAAIAAKLARPEATVICFAGDGDFQMTGQELATAVENGANIRVLILNNGILGTIRMHQERSYPTRDIATTLRNGNPDFVKLAQAYGAYGERIERTEQFADAWARADAFDGPAVIELILDPEAISPAFSLSELTANALKK